MSKQGLLITFEGGEGAGKTTLINSLYAHLTRTGQSVIKTHQPGDTKAGAVIRSLLLDQKDTPLHARAELLLFLADRAQHVEEVIRPALNKGTIVLCDRYNDSTLAYQGVARKLEQKAIIELCDFATGALNPDLTFYLDLDPEIGLERVVSGRKKRDRIESENLSFHQEIRKAYLDLADANPSRFRILNGIESKEEIFQQASDVIDALLTAHR